jgi:hypothetical protein
MCAKWTYFGGFGAMDTSRGHYAAQFGTRRATANLFSACDSQGNEISDLACSKLGIRANWDGSEKNLQNIDFLP